jgi:hypothetical protein
MRALLVLQMMLVTTLYADASRTYFFQESPVERRCGAESHNENDEEELGIGDWVGGDPGRCFFSNREFYYPTPNFVEKSNMATDTWPGKRQDPFYDPLTR